MGTAYFTWLVTGVSTGIGLAITLVGIPLLTLVLAGARPLLAGERALANALIDADVPAAPLAPPVEGGLLKRLAAYSAALYAICAPIIAPFAPLELGFWRVNTVYEGFALVPFGLLALLASAWISAGMASLSRSFVRWGAGA